MKQSERFDSAMERLHGAELTPHEKAMFACEILYGCPHEAFDDAILYLETEIDDDSEEDNEELDELEQMVDDIIKEKMDKAVDKEIADE